MRMTRRQILAAAFAAIAAAPAAADDYLGSYVARISDSDHYNSNGQYLDSAAQMVRQDRANFHKYGIRDGEDDSDPWFRSNAQRGRLQTMLERSGAWGPGAKGAVLNGEPLVEVQVWSNRVRVNLL